MPISIQVEVNHKLSSILAASDVLNNKQNQLENLMERMLMFAPDFLDTQSSAHFSPIYEQKIIKSREAMTIMAWIAQKIFWPLLSPTDTGISFWTRDSKMFGDSYRENNFAACYVVLMAVIFSSTGFGSCAIRSCYAAFELFEILKDTGVKIRVKTWQEIDHTVVFIGSDVDGWKIYDPLTNPTILFDEDEYMQQVKTLLKSKPTQKHSVDVTITEKTVELYGRKLGNVGNFLLKERLNTTFQALKNDFNYRVFLFKQGIADPAYLKTEDAFEQVCAALGWENPESQMNHGLV